MYFEKWTAFRKMSCVILDGHVKRQGAWQRIQKNNSRNIQRDFKEFVFEPLVTDLVAFERITWKTTIVKICIDNTIKVLYGYFTNLKLKF